MSILFRNPNFLVLDEPTNDLDLPTLGVLENFLAEFPGCLVIVSHDRYFMDRLVDHLFVFEGDGVIRDFPGNYSQYRAEEKQPAEEKLPGQGFERKDMPTVEMEISAAARKKQLSYKEKREFESLEKEIASLSAEKERITQQLNSGATAFEELQQLSLRIGEVSRMLDEKEMRWLELSEAIG